jgi:elongator complex protein 3
MTEEQFYDEILPQVIKENFSEKELSSLKRNLAQKHNLKKIPTNINLLLHASPTNMHLLAKKLATKPTRTLSGVSPVAIMTKPDRCPHGKCTFCCGGISSPWGDVPQSYTGHEPATMRGIRNNYDSYLQTFNRLQQYILLGQNVDKIEIIVMGGTFPATPFEYQEEFVLGAFKAMNDFSAYFFEENGEFNYFKFKEFFELPGNMHDEKRANSIREKLYSLKEKNSISLEEEKKKNETAQVRCVALCIETKPDWGFLRHGNQMLKLGCTRVELGVQSVYDDVLAITHRGHSVADSIKSIQELRDVGFKINFHYMPGLPLTNEERDMAGMRQLFSDPDYKPDMIKFYPCMVAPGTPLYHQYKNGEFTPISTDEAAKRIAAIMKEIPEYCRVQRVQRDVPTKYWEAGVDKTNLRQYMDQTYDAKSRDIRAREPKNKLVNWDTVEIKVMEYDASGGKEFFISVEDTTNDILIGFCRLRFCHEFLRDEITPMSAIVRELHVYGIATALGKDGTKNDTVQHRGWGKKLMAKAEEIAQQHGKDKMVVISGVGAKEYYYKLGYMKDGVYVSKKLS